MIDAVEVNPNAIVEGDAEKMSVGIDSHRRRFVDESMGEFFLTENHLDESIVLPQRIDRLGNEIPTLHYSILSNGEQQRSAHTHSPDEDHSLMCTGHCSMEQRLFLFAIVLEARNMRGLSLSTAQTSLEKTISNN